MLEIGFELVAKSIVLFKVAVSSFVEYIRSSLLSISQERGRYLRFFQRYLDKFGRGESFFFKVPISFLGFLNFVYQSFIPNFMVRFLRSDPVAVFSFRVVVFWTLEFNRRANSFVFSVLSNAKQNIIRIFACRLIVQFQIKGGCHNRKY